MGDTITAKQEKILGFIREFIAAKGFPPTMREIMRRLRITSTGSVSYHLKALEAKGYLKRADAVSRGLTPIEGRAEDAASVPIAGRVGAGGGVIAAEDVEGRYPAGGLSKKTDFLLRVRGDSMDRAGILEGDLVQVRRQDAADAGDVVVALVAEGEEGVVKRLKRHRGGWVLESANPAYEPISGPFDLIGKVVGLIREAM